MLQTPTIDLNALATMRANPCISFYLPTGADASDPDQGRIRLKNMMRSAQDRLKEMGIRQSNEITESMEQAMHLADDKAFWARSGRGLAMFMSPGKLETFPLPQPFTEMLVVSDRFHIKPLLPLTTSEYDCWVLKVSKKLPRLYKTSYLAAREVEDVKLPKSMVEALHEEDLAGRDQQASEVTVGAQNVASHGHSDAKEGRDKVLRYCRILNGVVADRIKDSKLPLLLFGVEYECSIFREVNTYPHLLDDVYITGNGENMTVDEIHDRVVKALEPLVQRSHQEAFDRFQNAKAHDLGSNRLSEVVIAAANGRIDTLMVGKDVQCWGSFEKEANKVHWHKEKDLGDMDLLDFAAMQTRSTGGRVLVLDAGEIPDAHADCPVAAIMRYNY